MTFEEILNQAIALLQRQGRVSYRALQRQFDLDEAYIEDLKLELIEVHQVAVDQNHTTLVWPGGATPSLPASVDATLVRTGVTDVAPLAYTPSHLTEKILDARLHLEGERKQITVLFADLKNSTELIRGLDPEAAQQLLDPALQRMMDAVHRFEGTVNQVLGDGIMALFGAPIAHEDHALRACYAALAMQAAMQPYTEEVRRSRGLELLMRVGLNAGEVVVRAIGNDLHMDYSAVGETTVLAARMEQMATPGTIRLPAATLRLVEGLVQVTALGPVPVKGLSAPVEVFELTRASSLRRRLQVAVDRGLTRFVGRQPELEAGRQARERVGAGHGQVVALVGDAGVGKSRLVYEYVHAQDTQGWRVLESASVSYGKATPYFPVIELLKRYTQIEDVDDPRTRRARLTGQVLTLDEALQDTLPPLLALLDALPEDSPFRQLEPSQRRRHTLSALKRLLLRESQEQPLLLVFEDLHWIDAETQTLLDSLPLEEKRLLQTAAVIGTDVSLALLQAIADMPEAVLRRGIAHLQTAEFLYETSLFPEQEYTFKHALTHEVAYSSLLLERRRVLHARLVEALEALVPERMAEQVECLAHHALRGEVWAKALMYGRQAGEKAMTRSAHREAIGYFEQALGVLPHLPEQRDTLEQGVDLRLALRTALGPSGNLERTLSYLREAESLAMTLDDPRRLGRVLLFLANHGTHVGAYDQAIAAAQRALALDSAGGEVALRAHQYLGQAYEAQGDYRQAIDSTVASLDRTRRHERFGQLFLPAVTSHARLAMCHAALGMFVEGRVLGEEGVRIAEEVAPPGNLMRAYHGLGLLALRQGDLTTALPLLARALGICQDADLPGFFPMMAAALGAAYILDRRIADAVSLLTQAMEQTIATERVIYQALCGLALGEAQLLAGHLEEALALTERTLALARERQERGHQAYALRLLGNIAARRDPPEGEPAVAHYQQALALAEELGMRPLQAHCHLGLGTLYATTGQRQQAHTALSTAINLSRAMDMTFWLPQAEAALAQVA